MQFEGGKKDVGEFLELTDVPPLFWRHGGVWAKIVKEDLPNKYLRRIEFWDRSIALVYTHPKWKFRKGYVWVKAGNGNWDVGRYELLGEYDSHGARMK